MLRKGKNHSGPEERRKDIFHSVYCPKSGNLLMKCTCGTSQIVCPKCRAVIICRIWDDKVEIYEDRRQKEVMAQAVSSYYIDIKLNTLRQLVEVDELA